MSLRVRIVLILVVMGAVIGVSYWYMQITTGLVAQEAEKKWRLHDHLLGVSFCDELNGWAVGQYGTILHSTTGGKTWEYQKSDIHSNLIGVCAVSPERACAVGEQGVVIITTDAGATWQRVSVGLKYLFADVQFVDRQEGWIVGEFEAVLHSTDGGTNWQLVHGGEPAEIDFSQVKEDEILPEDFGIEEEVYTLKRIHFLNPETGWSVGEYGTILKTVDHGTTWQKQNSGTDHSLCDVSFLNADFGFAVGLDGIILKTTDGGTNWQKNKPTVIAHYYGVDFKRYGPETTRNDAIAVGQGVIASYSYFKNPYLQNWVPALELDYKIDYNWLSRITFISRTGEEAIAVGDRGLIFRTDNGGDEWDLVRYPEKDAKAVLQP